MNFRNILKKIIYNKILYFFSSKFIIHENLLKNIYKKKKIYENGGYLYFLYKKLRHANIKDRILKKIFIILYTIIYELSSDCCINNVGIEIESNIKNLKIDKLIDLLKAYLPQGITLRIKTNEKYKYIIYNNKPIYNYHKIILTDLKNKNKVISQNNYSTIFYILINLRNKKIEKIRKKNLENSRKDWNLSIPENVIFNKIKNKFDNKIQIKDLEKIPHKRNSIRTYTLAKETIISNYYVLDKKFFLKKKTKFFFNKKEKLSIIKNANVSFHALISINGYLVKESIVNSFWDYYFLESDKYLFIPKITKTINGKSIILPTASNHLGHYIFESLVRLSCLSNFENTKFIVHENISPYLIEILLAYGIKKNQILKKPVFETWNIKELVFINKTWFQLSQKESYFLSNRIINKKINNSNSSKKIYISRRDARDNRNLINEEEIEKSLALEGFEIILASKLNIYQKINILQNAEIIITTLGSGIFNLFFCKNIKAKIVLIGTKRYFIKDFIQIAFFKKIKLFFLEANEIPSYSKQWQYQVSSFFIEIKKLKILLTKLDKFS
jgi:hypothetical protein